ncbi:putative chromatin regulator PHD family [Helianthus annuus]|nr:putative chromatin regulator PHD family [Helianthus annuus]
MVINIFFFICFIILIFLINSLKNSVLNNFRDGRVNPHFHEDDVCMLDLPAIQFKDLQNHRPRSSIGPMCFICSKYYDKDDVVCQLSQCGDIFHSNCVGKLLNQKQTSCPFCHVPFFSGHMPVLCKR